MKYWRGYLTAAIIALFSWALIDFAAAHSNLIDMVYPYVTRMLQTSLADWTGGVDFTLWQVLLSVLVVGVLASGLMMILLRWNAVQWFGWVLTAASVLFLLHTGIYGLNNYAGSIADDIRLEVTEYTLSELENATVYFRDKANELADQIRRDSSGDPEYPSFRELAEQAGEGFNTLVYEESYSIFAGSTVPVKELGWENMYTSRGTSGVTVALTGESAVNPKTPAVAIPFAMCHEMAHRMCIAVDSDANLSAFLACRANSSIEFQYSAYFMAYRYCQNALELVNSNASLEAAGRVAGGVNDNLYNDLAAYEKFFSSQKEEAPTKISGLVSEEKTPVNVCDLLVSWHIREFVLPLQTEDDTKFDPYDESQVDLSGIVNAPTKEDDNAQNAP